jgi:hypothetical protein
MTKTTVCFNWKLRQILSVYICKLLGENGGVQEPFLLLYFPAERC